MHPQHESFESQKGEGRYIYGTVDPSTNFLPAKRRNDEERSKIKIYWLIANTVPLPPSKNYHVKRE